MRKREILRHSQWICTTKSKSTEQWIIMWFAISMNKKQMDRNDNKLPLANHKTFGWPFHNSDIVDGYIKCGINWTIYLLFTWNHFEISLWHAHECVYAHVQMIIYSAIQIFFQTDDYVNVEKLSTLVVHYHCWLDFVKWTQFFNGWERSMRHT